MFYKTSTNIFHMVKNFKIAGYWKKHGIKLIDIIICTLGVKLCIDFSGLIFLGIQFYCKTLF